MGHGCSGIDDRQLDNSRYTATHKKKNSVPERDPRRRELLCPPLASRFLSFFPPLSAAPVLAASPAASPAPAVFCAPVPGAPALSSLARHAPAEPNAPALCAAAPGGLACASPAPDCHVQNSPASYPQMLL